MYPLEVFWGRFTNFLGASSVSPPIKLVITTCLFENVITTIAKQGNVRFSVTLDTFYWRKGQQKNQYWTCESVAVPFNKSASRSDFELTFHYVPLSAYEPTITRLTSWLEVRDHVPCRTSGGVYNKSCSSNWYHATMFQFYDTKK